MRRVMVRLDDDLYRALNDTAHDQRQSMNAWIVGLIEDAIGQSDAPPNPFVSLQKKVGQ